jgi:hypothetical protein
MTNMTVSSGDFLRAYGRISEAALRESAVAGARWTRRHHTS